MSQSLHLEPLIQAIARLEEAVAIQAERPTDTLIRDGLVQRFEFTYELSHKLLKRYLESSSPSPQQIDAMSFSDLIRTANEQGLLLHDWPTWRSYREMRSRTSHTYSEDVALQVVAGIPGFLAEAKYLCQQLQNRLA